MVLAPPPSGRCELPVPGGPDLLLPASEPDGRRHVADRAVEALGIVVRHEGGDHPSGFDDRIAEALVPFSERPPGKTTVGQAGGWDKTVPPPRGSPYPAAMGKPSGCPPSPASGSRCPASPGTTRIGYRPGSNQAGAEGAWGKVPAPGRPLLGQELGESAGAESDGGGFSRSAISIRSAARWSVAMSRGSSWRASARSRSRSGNARRSANG